MRVGLIQNSISLPTTAHFVDQKKAIFEKLGPIIDDAGSSGGQHIMLASRLRAHENLSIDFLILSESL